MPNRVANHAGDGSSFYEEPGERGPLTFPELLAAHKAFKMALAGLVERPSGVSPRKWIDALDFASDVTPGLCWVLGHLGGPGARALDMLVRAAGPITGGLPDSGPDSYPYLYQAVFVPPGACRTCGINHNPQLPHEVTPIYQQYFFATHGRRNGFGCWPTVPPEFTPPHWFEAKVQAMYAECQKHLR